MSRRPASPGSPLFLALACFFVTSLLISNIIAGKLALFFGATLPAAVILFPLTYIFGDVLTEVYGFRRARLVIWIGLATNLFMAAVFMLTLILPHPAFWTAQSDYAMVLGMTPRLVLASAVAYTAGQFSNSIVLSRLKVATHGRLLWVRTIGSTVVGEGFDTIIFISIAFAGTVPAGVLGAMMLGQYLWKVAYEVVATPLTYAVVARVKRSEHVDALDIGVTYNPFSLEATDDGRR